MSRWFRSRSRRTKMAAGGATMALTLAATALVPRWVGDGQDPGLRVTAGSPDSATSGLPAPDHSSLEVATPATGLPAGVPASSPGTSPSTTSGRGTTSSVTAPSSTTTTSTTAPGGAACDPIDVAEPSDAPAAGAPSLLGDIVYTREADGDADIWTMKPDGSGSRKLISLPGADTDADLSPDGTRIVWLHSTETLQKHTGDPQRVPDVMVANADGTGIRRLTTAPAPYPGTLSGGPAGYWNPRWSGDGTRVLFLKPVGEDAQRNVVYDVLTARPDGTDVRTLFSYGGLAVSHVDWSPDGEHLVVDNHHYHVDRGGLWLVDLNRCAVERMISDAVTSQPAWSPDGRRIAFTNQAPASGATVLTVWTDGSDQLPNVTVDSGRPSHPRWSVDGSRLLFTWTADEPTTSSQIASVAPDGSGLVVLGPGMTPGT